MASCQSNNRVSDTKFETGDVAGLIKPISVDIGIRGTCGTCVNRLLFQG